MRYGEDVDPKLRAPGLLSRDDIGALSINHFALDNPLHEDHRRSLRNNSLANRVLNFHEYYDLPDSFYETSAQEAIEPAEARIKLLFCSPDYRRNVKQFALAMLEGSEMQLKEFGKNITGKKLRKLCGLLIKHYHKEMIDWEEAEENYKSGACASLLDCGM